MPIQLVAPDVAYRETFLRGLREFQAEGLRWWLDGDVASAERDFEAFVAKRLADARPPNAQPSDLRIAKTHLWALLDGQFVGRIAIHHALSDALRVEGGHIGYDTVPSFRGRGVATAMLRQALPRARALGVGEVLITCDDTNAGSIRVIERCGGVLRETRTLAADRPPKRYYWIALG